MPRDPDAIRAHLEALRQELQRLDAMSAGSRAAVTLDQQSVGRVSRVDALQRQAMAEATGRQRAAEIRRIDAALARLADGDYGWCEACGEAIAPKRLEIDPAAALCIGCAGAGKGR
jgi:DnaK suppressor protein